uniref:Uncharacterized protein n=1 Tax=Romanomermis culicivorax TaxID=13658 RepID=A0A915JBI2_ROMCU
MKELMTRKNKTKVDGAGFRISQKSWLNDVTQTSAFLFASDIFCSKAVKPSPFICKPEHAFPFHYRQPKRPSIALFILLLLPYPAPLSTIATGRLGSSMAVGTSNGFYQMKEPISFGNQ